MSGSLKWILRSIVAVVVVAISMFLASRILLQAQVPCGQTGNHLIHVGKTHGSKQLVDCESATISMQNHNTVTWQAGGNDTISIEFSSDANPFVNFTCNKQKMCTADTIDPNAKTGVSYKYNVTLKSGWRTYHEDPGVIIQP